VTRCPERLTGKAGSVSLIETSLFLKEAILGITKGKDVNKNAIRLARACQPVFSSK
jgi:hypothetical protein